MNGRDKYDDPVRCGCFESYWYAEFGKYIGHGVLMRSRRNSRWPQASGQPLHPHPYNACGWVSRTGEDENGYYVDIERAELCSGASPLGVPSGIQERHYLAGITGVSLYLATKDKLLAGLELCAENGHLAWKNYSGFCCFRCNQKLNLDSVIDPQMEVRRCRGCAAVKNQEEQLVSALYPRRLLLAVQIKGHCPFCNGVFELLTVSTEQYCRWFGHVEVILGQQYDRAGELIGQQAACLRCKQEIEPEA
jgi:hypothetical protein